MTDRILAKMKEKEEEAKKKAESKHLKTEPSKPSKSVASARKPMKRNQTEAHIKTAKQSHEAPKKTIPNSKSVSNFNRTAGAKKDQKEAPTGHSPAHVPQLTHESEITYAIMKSSS